jgi:uncharacterized protein (TIGR00269 family)
VEQRVWKANRRFRLLRNGDRVVVGVSGGKDSAALLDLLNKMSGKARLELLPVFVDTGTPRYSRESREHAEKLCESMGLELTVLSYKKEFGLTLKEMVKRGERNAGGCAYCGVFGRRLFNKVARQLGADKVAIGHNLDDVAETFFMNVLRGNTEGIARFNATSGVAEDERFVKRIRPLVFVPEEECAAYCRMRKLPVYDEDCPYKHEAFRREAEAFLNASEAEHPGTKFAVVNTALALQERIAGSDAGAEKVTHCRKCGEPSSREVCKACELLAKLRAKQAAAAK